VNLANLHLFFGEFGRNNNNSGPSNKFIFRATYGNSIVCNILTK
jgi:hypothetical protein